MRQSWPMLAARSLGMLVSACGAFPGAGSMALGSAGASSAAGGSAGASNVEGHAGQVATGVAGAQGQAGAPATGQAGAATSGNGAGGSAPNGGAAGAGDASGAAGAGPITDSIVNVTFDKLPLGKYSLAQVASEWGGTPRWENGLADGRAEIVGGSDAYSGQSLRITYPANVFGPEGRWRAIHRTATQILH